MRWFDYVFQNTESPQWLRRLNYISLAGILAWPLIAISSLFTFNLPKNDFQWWLIYLILINIYPVYLLVISFLSFKVYRISPVVAAILPSIPLLGYVIVGVIIVVNG